MAAAMMPKVIAALAVCTLAVCTLTACSFGQAAAGRSAGSTHTVRLQQPPAQAARCFARNAEEHSSALVAEVAATRDGGAQTIVRVKNGVTYATADIRRASSGSSATITLMVMTSGSRSDLLGALVEGC